MIGYANYPEMHSIKIKMRGILDQRRKMRKCEEPDVLKQMDFLCGCVFILLVQEVEEAMTAQMDEGF